MPAQGRVASLGSHRQQSRRSPGIRAKQIGDPPQDTSSTRSSELPTVTSFRDDFHLPGESQQAVRETIAARRAHLEERLTRLKRNDFSLAGLPPNPLHRNIVEMETELKELKFVYCRHCDELLFDQKLKVRDQRCSKCSHEWRHSKPGQIMMWSEENDMHCTDLPPELQNLTPVEQSAIQRLSVVMKIYRLAGGALHLKGHCLTLLQDLEGFMTRLPPAPKDLPMIFLIGPGHRVSVGYENQELFVAQTKPPSPQCLHLHK